MDVNGIRASIPALARCIYLNTGTFGPMPSVVANEIRRAYRAIEDQGTFAPSIFREMELAGFEAVRHQVAALLGAKAEEIALTRNVSDGINIVLHGLDWRAGDEVILSDQEHPSGTVPWLALAERAGVRLRWLTLPVGLDSEGAGDEIVARFERLLGARTRLASLSHVSCLTGQRLPVERLCAAARARGVLTLIDGAHAEGQFAVDVRALGCDFYAACGHKWLLGPQGTGMLFVRRDLVPALRPAWLGWGVNQELDRTAGAFMLEPSAARFEQSTRAWPLYLAFGKAIEFVEGVGLDAIEARVSALRAAFVAELQALPAATPLSPVDRALSTGLVTASLAGWECQALSERLWQDRRILTNVIREFNALRFSLAFFTTEEELDITLDSLKEMTPG